MEDPHSVDIYMVTQIMRTAIGIQCKSKDS